MDERLVMLAGQDDRETGGELSVQRVTAVDGRAGGDVGASGAGTGGAIADGAHHVNYAVEAVPADALGVFPTQTDRWPGASVFEREAQDHFGLTFEGTPDARRLLLHDDGSGDPYRFASPEGADITVFPVGPVHAGVIGSGHFRFMTAGEVVLNLEPRLFYTHRGVERLAEGKKALELLPLVERIDASETIANSLAYCRAVEALYGAVIPEEGEAVRLILSELERIHSHLSDVAWITGDVGAGVAQMAAFKIREEVMGLMLTLTGSRFGRGAIVPGGVRIAVDIATAGQLPASMTGIMERIGALERLILGSNSVLDRLESTGRLALLHATELGVVGPAARASGIDFDSRRDSPLSVVDGNQQAVTPMQERTRIVLSGSAVPTLEDGDCLSRVLVRFAEMESAGRLINLGCCQLSTGHLQVELAGELSLHHAASAWALGIAESARGETVHLLTLEADGRTVRRYKPRTASRVNWPALPLAFTADILPDFPVVNRSFNLSYAGSDL